MWEYSCARERKVLLLPRALQGRCWETHSRVTHRVATLDSMGGPRQAKKPVEKWRLVNYAWSQLIMISLLIKCSKSVVIAKCANKIGLFTIFLWGSPGLPLQGFTDGRSGDELQCSPTRGSGARVRPPHLHIGVIMAGEFSLCNFDFGKDSIYIWVWNISA